MPRGCNSRADAGKESPADGARDPDTAYLCSSLPTPPKIRQPRKYGKSLCVFAGQLLPGARRGSAVRANVLCSLLRDTTG